MLILALLCTCALYIFGDDIKRQSVTDTKESQTSTIAKGTL